MRIARFCCCNVRTACLVFGILNLFNGLYGVSEARKGKSTAISTQYLQREVGMSSQQAEDFSKTQALFAKLTSSSSGIALVVNGLMIYAVLNEKEKFLLPALFYIPVLMFYTFLTMILMPAITGWHAIYWSMELVWILVLILYFFEWLCVYSHRKEIQEKNQNKFPTGQVI